MQKNLISDNRLVWVIMLLLLVPILVISLFISLSEGLMLLAGLCLGVGMIISLSAVEKLHTINKLGLSLPLDIMMDSAQAEEMFSLVIDNEKKKIYWTPKKNLNKFPGWK